MSITAPARGKRPLAKKLPTLARRIKQLREAAEMSQQQLAVAAGLSVSVVSQLEQGARDDPRASTVKAIADVLKVPMDELFRESE